MWDPSVGAGTVPSPEHRLPLFPLGPYYWSLDAAGLPAWVGAALVCGPVFRLRCLRSARSASCAGSAGPWPAPWLPPLAYGFSPYLLSYLARLSAILFPWAALPWLILLAARRAARRSLLARGQHSSPLVVALVGSVNATSLLFVGLGPGDLAGRRRGSAAASRLGPSLAAAGRIALLCAAVSAWWIAGLRVQGMRSASQFLDFTESYQTVASASAPQEILRGLGYWFFYGGDRLDPWIGPAFPYFNAPRRDVRELRSRRRVSARPLCTLPRTRLDAVAPPRRARAQRRSGTPRPAPPGTARSSSASPSELDGGGRACAPRPAPPRSSCSLWRAGWVPGSKPRADGSRRGAPPERCSESRRLYRRSPSLRSS